MKRTIILLSIACCMTPAIASAARLDCNDFKAKLEEKFQAKGVKNYTLEAVDMKADDGGAKVVGTCDGNTKKMLYKRGAADATKAEPKAAPKAEPKAAAPKADAKPAEKPAAPKADAKPAAAAPAAKTEPAKPAGK
jgi:Protein of unknown function (DUF1161)